LIVFCLVGKIFGNGTYFTDTIDKADIYTRAGRSETSRYLILSMVHMGTAYGIECATDRVQTEFGRVTQVNQLCGPVRGFDTSIAVGQRSRVMPSSNACAHNEFVVYDDNRCLPLYIVEYKHRKGECKCQLCPHTIDLIASS